MRHIKRLGYRAHIVFAVFLGLAATLGIDVRLAHPQQDDAKKLSEQSQKLSAQGRFSDAIPLAQRALAISEKSLGPDHPDVATALNSLAELYYDLDRYADAEPLYKRSLAIREKFLGPDHPDVATALNSLADLYDDQRRYADAEPLYKRSLAIREKSLGPDHPFVATALDRLAGLYSHQHRYADAEMLYKQSLALREKSLGPDHPDVATALHNLAYLYYVQGRYTDAELFYKQSLAIREKSLGPDHPDVATALDFLAEVYSHQHRDADAELLAKRSLVIREKSLGPDHPDVAMALDGLANLYDEQGRYADAEPLYKRSLAIREKSLGPDHPAVATALKTLAEWYHKQGRDADAEPLFKRSLVIYEKSAGPDHYAVANTLNDLASLYLNQGRYADAEPLIKRSLVIREKRFGPNHPAVAESLNNLASLYEHQGRYADSEPLFKRSLIIYEKSAGPDHPLVAVALNNLASLYEDQGRYADAEPLFKRSLVIRETSLRPDHPDIAIALNNLASLYDDEGRYADAEPLYKRSLDISEKSLGPGHTSVAIAQNNLAGLYRKQGRYADALSVARRTIIERTSETSVVFPVLLDAQKAKLVDEQQAFADSYNVLQFSSSSAAAAAVTQLAQRYAAGSGELATLVRKDQDLGVEDKKLDIAIIAAVSKDPNERNQSTEDQLRKRLAEIKIERDKIQETLGQKFPDYVALSRPQPLTLADTQKLLGDDEAVVAFSVDEKRSYAWVVTRSEGFWTAIPATSKKLNEQVQQLRQSLTANTDKPFDAALAHKIYQQTFGPIATRLKDKTRLSVIANGALTSIPFGLLVTTDAAGKSLKETDWLIKSYAITILPSVYSLKTMRTQAAVSKAQKTMIAFADPVFSKQARAQANAQQFAMRSLPSFYQGTQLDVRALGELLSQLPGTRAEVQSIAATLGVGSSDPKLGLDATVTAVKAAKLDQYRIVYFATHGLVSGDLERFSRAKAEPALALTIPDIPTALDDGLLQASEVAGLKLDADWVVLSACNTASSDGVGAEALSGLARAFLYAGGRSLVVSHWEVDDVATASLMSNLFDIFARKPGLSHGEALREATLKLLNEAKTPMEAHPRVWAPFVVVGEPR
jgi:CHAT domain-containing protein